MAVFNEPAQWDHTLGNNADISTLPDDAAATAGIASLQKLFQIINATPLEAGGIAPDREDVNALFKYLGDQIFYTQNGGIPSYNAAYDYIAGRVVLYNGNLYKCIQVNGVSSTVVTPGSDTAYWQRLDNYVRSVNGVNADENGNVKTLKEEWHDENGNFYRVYSDGWCEQGGRKFYGTQGLKVINLYKPMKNNNYIALKANGNGCGADWSEGGGAADYSGRFYACSNLTTTSFEIYCSNQNTQDHIGWYVFGMGA